MQRHDLFYDEWKYEDPEDTMPTKGVVALQCKGFQAALRVPQFDKL